MQLKTKTPMITIKAQWQIDQNYVTIKVYGCVDLFTYTCSMDSSSIWCRSTWWSVSYRTPPWKDAMTNASSIRAIYSTWHDILSRCNHSWWHQLYPEEHGELNLELGVKCMQMKSETSVITLKKFNYKMTNVIRYREFSCLLWSCCSYLIQ